MTSINSIQAVHDDDIETLLKSLGVLEKVDAGNYRCIFCGAIITKDNIAAVIPVNKEIEFSCDSPLCSIKVFSCGE